jgi:hypothetical protein
MQNEEFYPRGVIVAFHPDRGFGFLRLLRDPTDRGSATKDMPSYFFHFKSCGLPKEALHPGLIVDFELASRNGSGNELNPPRDNTQAINFIPIEEVPSDV